MLYMPAYKDKNTGKWYCRFYYQDLSGTRKQKMKRGFELKRDAQQWENEFLKKAAGSPDMTFGSLIGLYLDTKKRTLKPSTYRDRTSQISHHILPHFKGRTLSEITEKDIKKWQFALMDEISDTTGRPLSAGTRRLYFRILTGIFNLAIKECGLAVNPCSKCGNLNEKPQKHMDFWTQEEFQQFIRTFQKDSHAYVMFMVLYYTGIRAGELLALTPADIDLKKKTISISKTLAYSENGMVIQSPKTASSNRIITVPTFLCDIIAQYESCIYDLQPEGRLFYQSRGLLFYGIKRHAEMAGLKKIRVHDLRHSHASLLINLGYSPLEVAKRLGHEKPSMTLDVYSHMFATKQEEIADKLQEIHLDIENNIK